MVDGTGNEEAASYYDCSTRSNTPDQDMEEVTGSNIALTPTEKALLNAATDGTTADKAKGKHSWGAPESAHRRPGGASLEGENPSMQESFRERPIAPTLFSTLSKKMSFQQLMVTASPRELRYMNDLSDAVLLEDFSSTILQAWSRFKHVLDITDDLAKEWILKNELSTELKNLKSARITEIEKACKTAREKAEANFSHSIKGIAMMNDNYQRRHEVFLLYPEYQEMLVDSALQYYCHGFRTCVKQLVEDGHLTCEIDISFLQEGAGLDSVPELGEEAHACVLSIHAILGDKLKRIPPDFVSKYKQCLPEKVTIETDVFENLWDVKIEKIDDDYWMTKGWKEFVQENC
ncbi:hypothetical protein BUALT_Bualt19G0069900 [Buddleja alternifolia]|uniref:TF-B3 domain-containing protein n=1 Tax=Buddleja alternifolia TaxID=168488 RepID=A0AAV6WA16_9LAMI|nr:hypothetical protein BUALT_Bualt19G0069900 [Buddleja alternifolia]